MEQVKILNSCPLRCINNVRMGKIVIWVLMVKSKRRVKLKKEKEKEN
jgi:hypothetical protein